MVLIDQKVWVHTTGSTVFKWFVCGDAIFLAFLHRFMGLVE